MRDFGGILWILQLHILGRCLTGHPRLHCAHRQITLLVKLHQESVYLTKCDHRPQPNRKERARRPSHFLSRFDSKTRPAFAGHFNCRQWVILIVVTHRRTAHRVHRFGPDSRKIPDQPALIEQMFGSTLDDMPFAAVQMAGIGREFPGVGQGVQGDCSRRKL